MRDTVLDAIEEMLRLILDNFCRTTEKLTTLADAVDRFAYVDAIIYPLEFVGAVYELDEIDYVRISPQDAQTGLSKGPARDKIAGDELFHFSAFLRKDFRSNDILRGTALLICQIVHTLLARHPRTACSASSVAARVSATCSLHRSASPGRLVLFRDRVARARARMDGAVDGKLVGATLPTDERQVVTSAPLREAWDAFCTALIVVGQEDAFQDTFPEDPRGSTSTRRWPSATPAGPTVRRRPSSRTVLEGGAARAAHDQLEDVAPSERWQLFSKMHLGSQPLNGRASVVPPHIVGEYVTQIYLLLWGMVRCSVGPLGQRVMDQQTVRTALRHPVAFLNLVFFLMRRSDNLALGTRLCRAPGC